MTQAYVRSVQDPGIRESLRKMGPLGKDSPALGEYCPGCDEPFKEGDYVTVIAFGPGKVEEERKRAREGKVYDAVAIRGHWACVTGSEE